MKNLVYDKIALEKNYKETLLQELLDKKYAKLFKYKNQKSINRLKRFKQILKLHGIDETIKEIIFADFNELNNLKNTYGVITLSFTDKEFIEKSLYKEVRNKFGYKLVELLNLKVCPYCNRNYIVNFNKTNTTVQLDHFYDKSSYFYLAISLYNLIPSCSICNLRKSKKDDEILYPYLDNFDDLVNFKYEGINSNSLLNFFHPQRVKLSISSINNKVQNSINIFNINELYQEHRDIVSEILKRKEMYPKSRIDELYNQYVGKLFNSKDELIGLINCNYIEKEKINQRPLSKLTKDILEQI